jgi:hypothetical protein
MFLNELFQMDETGGVGVVAGNKKMAADPRYSMSMTKDVKPGETQKQAKKFGNKTDKLGLPPVARTNGQVAEAVMSTTMQGHDPVSKGARGLMAARWRYDTIVKDAMKDNTQAAVDQLANRLPELDQVNYETVDGLMKQICMATNSDPEMLHKAFIRKYKLTPDAYAAKLKHDINHKHKQI